MNLLKQLISYIYPINVKTITSERSGTLEVTLVNGKLVMDSANANYSYGSLQKVLKKGLSFIGKNQLEEMSSILVLGVAGGSVIQTIRNDFKLDTKITAIEIDPDVIALANTYFQLNNTDNVELITADAFEYIKSTTTTYDLIIVDIFNDTQMPEELFRTAFWKHICKLLTENGLCIFNSIYTSTNDLHRNSVLKTQLTTLFKQNDSIKTNQINEVIIVKK
ncbi:MAG: spermidine synthase [Flavobacteriaceae bacterium]